MKKLFFVVFMLTFCLTINAQTDNSLYNQGSSKPQISFEKTLHNFGSVKKKADASFEFVFKNTGKGPLIVSNVTTSCDCTTPVWPKEPIMPGKTGKIKVGYDTKDLGIFNKTITVYSNGVTNPVTLTIQGDVYE
ncbi:MAG: hypothetical protein CVU05_10260 [Bacteroidetes bacterium HGW-Bacteroidetes-21]|jgi:hypothetical protein|nr:MAG: hypothetical protein CVU05_10260 [Bacteroidetes bacterium HGW-Bacteroidetes-21]